MACPLVPTLWRLFFERALFPVSLAARRLGIIPSRQPEYTKGPANPPPSKVKVYVSLTTIPSRIHNVHKCIESLLGQTLKPERIFLCVPQIYKRFGIAASIPQMLDRYGGSLQVVHCPQDYGPGTKLLAALPFVPRDPDCLLVLVDDDVVYKNYMLETFATAYGRDSSRGYSFWVYRYRGVSVGQGVDGFAVPASCFDDVWSFYGKIQHNEYVFFVDDLWISFFLHIKGVPVSNVAGSMRERGRIYKIYNDADALCVQRPPFTSRRCMTRAGKFLKATFPT